MLAYLTSWHNNILGDMLRKH